MHVRRVLIPRENDDGEAVRDVEHISELIKRRCTPILKKLLMKVIRDKASPEAALRYSNLYSRLQAQVLTSNTILTQACIIK